MSNPNNASFFEKVKKAGKSLVDGGAKTMLRTDVVFLEREIKQRKQSFGVEVYELMESLELDMATPIERKEQKIRLAFDQARKDIAVVSAKIECKKEEVLVLEAEADAEAQEEAKANQFGNPNTIVSAHPDDSMASEMEHSN